jgi:WD40 repeat protein
LLVAGLLLISACTQVDTSTSRITNTPITPTTAATGNFDDVEIDQADHRLYAADRDRGIDVFDISTPTATFVQAITLPSAPNGLAIAPDLGRLYAGTADGSVQVLDINPASPTAGKLLAAVQTGGKEVDLLDYSANRHELYASSGSGGTIAIIDANKSAVTGRVKVGYALEQPRFNPADGMLYVTSPDADALFQIDLTTLKVKNKSILGGCQPTGLAIDPRSNEALIACAYSTVSWNLRSASGQNLTQGGGGDVVSYDAKAGRFFVASPGKAAGSTVAIFGGNPIAFISSVVTGAGGKAAAYNETNNLVYTTDFRPYEVGLVAFNIPDGAPTLSSLLSLAPLAALLPLIVLVLFIVGRQADPIRRPEPLPTLAEAKIARLDRKSANDTGQA